MDLSDIKEEIKDLVYQAKRHVERGGNKFLLEQAKAYWIPHILMALDKEHDYLGGGMVTMQDTIDALEQSDNFDCCDDPECSCPSKKEHDEENSNPM